MAEVEGEDSATVSLGAGDHRGIHKTERKIGIATHKLANAGQVLFSAIQADRSLFEIRKERVERATVTAALNEMSDLAERGRWQEIGGAFRLNG